MLQILLHQQAALPPGMVTTPTTPITQTPSPRKQNAELSSHLKSDDDADNFAPQSIEGNADVATAQV